MPQGELSGEIREAVEDLQAYLSDQVAPLLVLDSAHIFLAHSPELGAEVVRAWASGQLRSPGAAPVSSTDFLFHAVKKLQLLGKLKLIEQEPLRVYLEGLVGVLVAQAPELERDTLRTFLLQAAEAETSLASQVQVLYRPATATAPAGFGAAAAAAATPSAQVSAEIAANMRQFALLLSRLTAGSELAGGTGTGRHTALTEQAPQLVAAAAQSARTQAELEQHLASLSRAGLMTNVRLNELFATLSHGLPNWSLGEASGHESAPIQAMHRIVELAADPAHAASHLHELLSTVARQFNEHALGRAIQVLDVVRRLIAEGKVEKASADLMLSTAHEELDLGELMAQTQQVGNLPLLRRLLNFYPALTPEGLWRALDDEPDRARRRLWLALLEAHGVPACQAALGRLERSFREPGDSAHVAWLQRNFVYLLHRIRPAAGEDHQTEVRLSIRCAELANPAPLVREALINLGLRRHPEAEAGLRQRLEELERLLEGPPAATPHDMPELRRMLALVVSGLARQGTPTARRTVVEHGLAHRPALGDTLERLGELGGYDLAEDPELVDRLLAALRTQLPVRVLGLSIRRHGFGPNHLVRALQATRSEAVRAAFEDVARRFPAQAFGQAAAATLLTWNQAPAPPPELDAPAAAPVAPAAGLSGDLEVFGLPDLLQTLAGSEASGRLLLRDKNGQLMAELLLRKGELRETRLRQLRMPEAFYQILETPQPGTFEFTRRPAESVPAGDTYNVMGLLMEGMRRYDELQRAQTLAPDHVFIRSTGSRPSAPPAESDGAFIRQLWMRVKDGATPLQCEEALATDAYRVRTLLAHWLAEGTLTAVEAAENAPP